MLEFLQELDAQWLLSINGLHTPLADYFMKAFTGRWIWLPLYATLAWFLVRRQGWRNGLLCILAIGLAVTIADQTCATVIRPLVARMRPSNTDNPLSALVMVVDGYRGGKYGFPSCHAANTFALATFFALLCTRTSITPLLLLWALCNCYTRMYLGVHYPGDLLVGTLVGICAASLCYLLLRKFTSVPRISGNASTLPVLAVALLTVLAISIYAVTKVYIS